MSNFLPRRIWGFNFFRKTLVLGLSLAVALVSVSLIDQKLHLFTTAKKMAGEIAGVTIENANKFLSVGLAGAQASTAYQKVSGDVNISGNVGISSTTITPATLLQINGTTDTSPTAPGLTVLGPTTGLNISLDQNEIMARNNGAVSSLYLNQEGGDVIINGTNSTGNVGIGTGSPGDALEVNRNWWDSSATNWGGGIKIRGTAPSISFWDTDNTAQNFMLHTNSNQLNFYVRPSTGAWNQMGYFNSSGNLYLNQNLQANAGITSSGTIAANTGISVDGNVVIDDGAGWHRSYGNTGWYNNTYGGGWYMTDSTWIRSYGDKHIYIGGRVYATGQTQMGGNAHGWPDVGCTGCGDSLNGSPHLWLTTQNSIYMRGPSGRAWSPFDIAELFPIIDNSEPSDLVSIAQTDIAYGMRKSARPYDPEMAGAISQAPAILFDGSGLVFGYDTEDETIKASSEEEKKVLLEEKEKQKGKKPVALAGRIPLKVSTINGPIRQGDIITSSIIPGTGMKATRTGYVFGKAIEDFDESQAAACQNNPQYKCGKVLVFINLSWYDPDVYLTSTEGFTLNLDTLKDSVNNLVTRIGAFGKLIVGKIQAGIIETQRLIVNGVDILERLDSLSQKVETQQQEIESLKREIQQLKAR